MDRIVKASFSLDQVASLNAYQQAQEVHAFTCQRCREADMETLQARYPEHPEMWVLDNPHLLVASVNGWVCPNCCYHQDWAHAFMADWSWRSLRPAAIVFEG